MDRVVEHWVPWQENGPWQLSLETGVRHVIRIKREVIPVVFVPGIMGSRMINRQSGAIVWDPESKSFMLWNFSGMSAAERHQRIIGGPRFDPQFLDVFHHRASWSVRLAGSDEDLSAMRDSGERGFEGVSFGSYKDIIKALFDREKEGSKAWSDPVKRCFRLPVYSFGYNWTASNEEAGRELASRVTGLIAGYAAAGHTCRFAMLITHSMGGIVARAAMHFVGGFKEKILGVIHGVQPVTGSPAAYWRMKAGFERPGTLGGVSAGVLGPTAMEVTSILAHMPGGLQMLPTKHYRNNRGQAKWLHVRDPQVPGQSVKSLPSGGDPYASIYREQQAFWRLVDPAHLRPGGGGNAPPNPALPIPAPWPEFERVLGIAETFHDQLGTDKHDRTRTFYGTGTEHPTAVNAVYEPDGHYLLLTLLGWQPERPSTGAQALAGADGGFIHQLNYGKAFYNCWVQVGVNQQLRFTLLAGSGGGDGTVPESSGRALNVPIVMEMPAAAGRAPFTPLQLGLAGLEHEPAYLDNTFSTSDSHTFVYNGVEALCQDLIYREAGPG